MNYAMKRTLVIGIGGTGQYALLNLKKLFMDNYGAIPPMVKFLAIDTDEQSKMGDVKFESNEFKHLTLTKPDSVMESEHIRKWVPKIPNWIFTGTGAAQIRAAGRLYLHANSKDLIKKIKYAYNKLKGLNAGVLQHSVFSLPAGDVGDVKVFIVCSLAGGTGSGTIVDIAAILRNLIIPGTDELIGFLLFPDIFSGKTATKKVTPNTYAAMREINSFIQTHDNKYIPEIMGEQYPCPNGLFDHHFIINNNSMRGASFFTEVDELNNFLGLSLFHFIATFGHRISTVYSNLSNCYAEPINGQWPKFSSFGISEIQFPIDNYMEYRKLLISKEFFENITLGENTSGNTSEELQKDVLNFIRKIELEEHEADQLINSLAYGYRRTSYRKPNRCDKNKLKNAVSSVDSHLLNSKTTLTSFINNKKNDIITSKIDLIKTEVTEMLIKPNKGISYTSVFLAELKGLLQGYQNEMDQEKTKKKERRNEVDKKYVETKEKCKDDSKKLIITRKALEEDFDVLQSVVYAIQNLNLEIKKREAASDVYSHILDEIDDWGDNLKLLSTTAQDLITEINVNLKNFRYNQKTSNPFIKMIEVNFEDSKAIFNTRDVIQWLDKVKYIDIFNFSEMKKEEIKTLVFEFISTLSEIKNMADNTIEKFFDGLPDEEKIKYLQEMERKASPLWSYNAGKMLGREPERQFLLGVNDVSKFSDDLIEHTFRDPEFIELVSTGNPYKFICCYFEAPCPAYVIDNINKYYSDFKDKQGDEDKKDDSGNMFYTQKDLESKLAPIFPETDKENSMRGSLANAEPYDLIIKRGVFHWIRSKFGEIRSTKKFGSIKLLKLKQGRKQSFEAFMNNEELIKETQTKITALEDKLGNDSIVEKLKEHKKKLTDDISKATSDDKRNILNTELDDINKHINDLQS